jgi:hypothetical protein
MKYKVGDLLFIKKVEWKPHHVPYFPLPLRLPPHLHNTVGIITEVHKHSNICKSGSTEGDNLYICLSQVYGREYHFYQDEVDGEVFK